MTKGSHLFTKFDGTHFGTLDEVMLAMAEIARQTAAQGNYGVSTALVHRDTGIVKSVFPNTAVRPFYDGEQVTRPFSDAHAEREAMRFISNINREARRRNETGIDPQDLMVICNLAPCPMCTESMLMTNMGQMLWASTDDIAIGAEIYNTIKNSPVAQAYTAVAQERLHQVGPDLPAPRGSIYEGQRLSKDITEQATQAFHDSRASVREWRERAATVPWSGKDMAMLKDTEHGRTILEQLQKPGIAGWETQHYRSDLKIDPRNPEGSLIGENGRLLVDLLVDEAMHSSQRGNHLNAVAVFDPNGNYMFRIGDRTGEKSPIHTAYGRALKRIEQLHRDLPESSREHFATPGAHILVGLTEPVLADCIRMSTLLAQHVISLIPDSRGVKTTGVWENIPNFYKIDRKLVDSVREHTTLTEMAHDALMDRIIPGTRGEVTLAGLRQILNDTQTGQGF